MLDYIQKALFAVRSIGLRMTLRSVLNAWRRSRIEKKYPSSVAPPTGQPRRPGELQSVHNTERGALFQFEGPFKLELEFLTPQMARVSWQPGPPPTPYAVVQQEWPEVDVRLEQQGDTRLLSSSALTIKVHPCGTLEYLVAGNSLRTETPPQLDGSGWRQSASLLQDAAIYGLGERAAHLDLRPGSYGLWNTEQSGSYRFGADPLYVTIPMYLAHSQDGSYLLFYDNSFDGQIEFGENARLKFTGGGIHYYFILGAPQQALAQYTQLTGRPPLPPRWALGFHQSRWGYASEQDIRQVVEGFKQHDLPLDVVHMDIDYMDGFRVFTVDQQRYPDLKKLSDDLHEQAIHLVTILDPGVKIDDSYEVYREGLAQDAFCKLPDGRTAVGLVWPGWSVFPDFTKPAARRWWGQCYPRLLDQGVDGIWHDMNEPASMSAFGDPTMPRPMRHDMEGRGGDHEEGHNLYGLSMALAGFEAQKELRPDRRPWLLTRSGWAGMQRYSWLWTGDVGTGWDTLRMTLSLVLGSGMSGIAYNGSDIGGFTGHADAELFTRWFQMSSLMPFFRNHAARTTPRSEPWQYGEPTISICRRYLQLRHRLMPYLYTLAWQASQSGAPLVRPLFWIEPGNDGLFQIDDSFMLGEAIFAAPILEEGAKERQLVLPGGNWYDFWTDEQLTGGQQLTLPASLDSMPMFVRGGSVLPQANDRQITLHLYAPEKGEQIGSQWYDDAGDGYGAHQVSNFTMNWDQDILRVAWEMEGQYPLAERLDVMLHGVKPGKVVIDGKEIQPGAHLQNIAPFKQMLVYPGQE